MLKKSIIAIAAFSLCFAAAVNGADTDKTKKKHHSKKAAVATNAQKPVPASNASPGVMVVKDPETGELRAPTAAEAAQLQRTTNSVSRIAVQSAAPANQEFSAPSDAIGLKLDDNTTVYAVASRAADGTVKVGEATGPAAAKKAIETKPARPTNGGQASER